MIVKDLNLVPASPRDAVLADRPWCSLLEIFAELFGGEELFEFGFGEDFYF